VPECLQYSWSANVEASARVYGPPVYGRPQEAYDFASWNALRGAAQKIGCKGNNPDAWFRDESRYDWSNAWEQVNDALGRRFEETMKPRTEVASIALFDGGIDTPVNEKGVALARQSKWADALAAFDAAIVEQQATKPGNAQAKARLLHNRAAALMALGRLEEAAKTQLEAHAIEKDGDTAELGAEIAQRGDGRGEDAHS
jgi:tetratricopeptide (TPR) repeat protein